MTTKIYFKYFTDNLLCDGTVVESYSGNQLDRMKKGRIIGILQIRLTPVH